MIALVALRNFVLRPWRSALLLLGYSLGVAVMIVLLSIGEALLAQARDERLVGGGDVTVLPEGIDVEVLKTGGLGGLFFSVDHARFIYGQLLAAPRVSSQVSAVAPQIEDKLLYVRSVGRGVLGGGRWARGGGLVAVGYARRPAPSAQRPAPSANGREFPVMAGGEIPSRTTLVDAMPPMAAGTWSDDDLDREWRDPTPVELRSDIDHFHLPPAEARRNPTWAEWHYFNLLSPDRSTWAFISFIVGGEVPDGRWGGQVLVTLHSQGGASRRFVATVPASSVRFSTTRADVALGPSFVRVLDDGRYAIRARAHQEGGTGSVDVNLTIAPAPGAFFPGAALTSGETVSGYVVPALRADADGTICVDAACTHYARTQAYHDHNWGVWRGVTWEWGAARAGPYSVLYGRVQPGDSTVASQPLFVYVVDSLGFLALFRPNDIHYEDARTIRVGGEVVHVPARAAMVDARGDDTLRIALTIEDATATDTRQPAVERGDALAGRGLAKPFFVQMKGLMRLDGRIAGRRIGAEGAGFFETYR